MSITNDLFNRYGQGELLKRVRDIQALCQNIAASQINKTGGKPLVDSLESLSIDKGLQKDSRPITRDELDVEVAKLERYDKTTARA